MLPPLTGTVIIGGDAYVDRTLTANTAGLFGSGDYSFQWRRGTTNTGTNSPTYVVEAADIGFAITVMVTRSGNSGYVTSDPTTIVTLPPIYGEVIIEGSAYQGETLTANLGGLGGSVYDKSQVVFFKFMPPFCTSKKRKYWAIFAL